MIEFTSEKTCYLVRFQVMPQDDGQPDFIDAMGYLDKHAGSQNWTSIDPHAQFEAERIGGKTIYLMRIMVTINALHMLKWHDLIKDEVRIVEDKLASEANVLEALPLGDRL